MIDVNLSGRGIRYLEQVLKEIKTPRQVRSLNLSRNELVVLSNELSKFTALTRLSLVGNKLREPLNFVKTLQLLPKLSELSIDAFSVAEMETIRRSLPRVKIDFVENVRKLDGGESQGSRILTGHFHIEPAIQAVEALAREYGSELDVRRELQEKLEDSIGRLWQEIDSKFEKSTIECFSAKAELELNNFLLGVLAEAMQMEKGGKVSLVLNLIRERNSNGIKFLFDNVIEKENAISSNLRLRGDLRSTRERLERAESALKSRKDLPRQVETMKTREPEKERVLRLKNLKSMINDFFETKRPKEEEALKLGKPFQTMSEHIQTIFFDRFGLKSIIDDKTLALQTAIREFEKDAEVHAFIKIITNKLPEEFFRLLGLAQKKLQKSLMFVLRHRLPHLSIKQLEELHQKTINSDIEVSDAQTLLQLFFHQEDAADIWSRVARSASQPPRQAAGRINDTSDRPFTLPFKDLLNASLKRIVDQQVAFLAPFAALFDQFDANSDGRLDESEFRAFFSKFSNLSNISFGVEKAMLKLDPAKTQIFCFSSCASFFSLPPASGLPCPVAALQSRFNLSDTQ